MRGKMYYKLGTSIGLIGVFLVSYLMMGHAVFSLLDPSSGKSALGAIIGGFLSTFFIGHLFDQRRKKYNYDLDIRSAAIYAPLVIFTGGAIIGTLLNFAFSASIINPSFGLWEEFYDWLFKPLLWLLIFGVPKSILLGLLYYFVFCRLNPKNRCA
jgi:hypothetical protein